jgi:uncharacterized phage protein (TIGR02220 family)
MTPSGNQLTPSVNVTNTVGCPTLRTNITNEHYEQDITDKRTYVEQAQRVLAFLNEATNREFRIIDTNLNFVIARLKSGVTVKECEAVIMHMYNKWHNDDKMKQYLRPETLFNKTKFEQYLPEAKELFCGKM